MLDINLLRKDLDGVVARLQARKNPQAFLDVEGFKTLEAERKTIQTRSEDPVSYTHLTLPTICSV